MSIQLAALGKPAASRRERQTRAPGPTTNEATAFGERSGVGLLDVLLEHSLVWTDHAAWWRGRVFLPLTDWWLI